MNKKTKLLTTILCAISVLTSCTNEKIDNDDNVNEDEETPSSNILTTYFSCTNNTESIAEKIATSSSSTLIEILPTIPYTSADLNYNDQNSRANKEQNDPNARPEIKNNIDITLYSTIFIGYPIWRGRLPKIMYTFFDSYDFANKTIIPFATSGSSGISTSIDEIKNLEPSANILEGKRFATSTSQEEIDSWVSSLNL